MKTHTIHPQTEAIPSLVIHPSISPQAAELLLKTADILASQPERYNQGNLFAKYSPCGTACCIVGHMGLLIGENSLCTRDHKKVGLTYQQIMAICWLDGWPTETQHPVSPAQGIARIEWMLTTGT